MTLRSIGAVLAGFVTVFLVTTIVDVVLHATGVFPPWGETMSDGLFVLATAYRVVITVAGGYLTARFAPDRPMAHAMALGVVGFVAASIGAAVTWNVQPPLGPHWYPLALVVTALPCTWLGGSLLRRRTGSVQAEGVGYGAH